MHHNENEHVLPLVLYCCSSFYLKKKWFRNGRHICFSSKNQYVAFSSVFCLSFKLVNSFELIVSLRLD